MPAIETFASTFATLGLLTAAACTVVLIYAKIKGSPKPMRDSETDVVSFSALLALAEASTDLPHADHIEITIAEHPDGVRLWVNADGANAFRAYKVKNLTIDDKRNWSMAHAFKTAE